MCALRRTRLCFRMPSCKHCKIILLVILFIYLAPCHIRNKHSGVSVRRRAGVSCFCWFANGPIFNWFEV
uniref:Uncharacterized protein n=1 Tax=Rhizophora mucronata TaxID=61149 RepID=A0A2P2J1S9_RHIMU